MAFTRHIPNLITLGNLGCGCVAVVMLAQYNYQTAPDNLLYAFLFVCGGIFLDFFDGFFARMLKASSPLGLQLDSLADMVTSGVVPGLAMYHLLSTSEDIDTLPVFVPFLGFVITLGSCYRLANFNVDTRQTDSFIGLPTPANALFIMSLPLIKLYGGLIEFEILLSPWILLAITAVSAWIMNAEIPLFSLKVKKFDLKANALPIGFLLLALILLVALHYSGIPLVIMGYILLSVITNKKRRA
jgi:CDP-diacylglycerol--serine O-phosphatidyltransferase